MATSPEYLRFVLEQLSALEGLASRPMMGEYLFYYQGKLVGGVYDDRLLLKPAKSALALMEASSFGCRMEPPYPGARALLAADVDDPALCCRVIQAIAEELPTPKSRGKRG